MAVGSSKGSSQEGLSTFRDSVWLSTVGRLLHCGFWSGRLTLTPQKGNCHVGKWRNLEAVGVLGGGKRRPPSPVSVVKKLVQTNKPEGSTNQGAVTLNCDGWWQVLSKEHLQGCHFQTEHPLLVNAVLTHRCPNDLLIRSLSFHLLSTTPFWIFLTVRVKHDSSLYLQWLTHWKSCITIITIKKQGLSQRRGPSLSGVVQSGRSQNRGHSPDARGWVARTVGEAQPKRAFFENGAQLHDCLPPVHMWAVWGAGQDTLKRTDMKWA